jgi:acyl-coenzyme A synthetase/AMP-(fatty) acid ligase
LEAAERYRGKIIDLDAGRVVGPDDFARAREDLTARLRAEGLAPGDRVVLALPNGPVFIAALAALLAAEASPLLVHVKTPPAELERYARRFGARFLASAPSDEPGLEAILRAATRLPVGDFAELGWGMFDAPDEPPVGSELRGVPLHPTSGSTGLPKIALRPGFAAMEEARHYAATMAIDEDDCVFTIPPMSHAYGYGTCVMTPLLTSADIVSTARFSIKQLYRALRELPITVLPNVPANIDLLLFGGGGDFARLRWMLAAGSVLPERSARLFRQKTGVAVCPLYGTTETGGISVAIAADGRDVDGRVGPPMNGVEVQIRRSADDEQLGDDVGRLRVRSSSMMAGYLDDRGQITSPLGDGWFETGDLARIADDGVIHLRGRGTDVINVLGLKVVPQEVEEAIAACPGVREVKVYAGTRGARSEIVKAAVAVERGVTEADIRAHCEQHLVYYKRPQAVALVEALPRSPAGKIIAAQLP